MNIYISNLSFNIRDTDLKGFFTEYGEVSSARIIMDKMTNRSKGFGFVEMPDEKGAKNAMAALNGTTIDGRTIKVAEAREKEQRTTYIDNNDDGGFNNSSSYNQNQY